MLLCSGQWSTDSELAAVLVDWLRDARAGSSRKLDLVRHCTCDPARSARPSRKHHRHRLVASCQESEPLARNRDPDLGRVARSGFGRLGAEYRLQRMEEQTLAICYAVVVFSTVVQGLTLERVVRLTR